MYQINIVGAEGSHVLTTNSLRTVLTVTDALNQLKIPNSWELKKK